MSLSAYCQRNLVTIILLLLTIYVCVFITLNYPGLSAESSSRYSLRSSSKDKRLSHPTHGDNDKRHNHSSHDDSARLISDRRNDSLVPCSCDNKNITVEEEKLPPSQLFNSIEGSLTGKLWNFGKSGDMVLYLYDNVLAKKWTGNRDNLLLMRRELASHRPYLNGSERIVLHKGHVTPGQLFNPVFDTEHKTELPASIYDRLPKKNPFPHPNGQYGYKTCAVIGNSGSLLNSSCGASIDKNDFVFRCNLAPLKPFARDAGMRNNLTTMNPTILPKRYHSFKHANDIKRFADFLDEFNGLIWVPCFAISKVVRGCARTMSLYNGTNIKMVCGYPPHQWAVADFWKGRGLTRRMSSGFYMAMTAILLCEEVNLYGFWPYSTRFDGDKKVDVAYHYFDKMTSKGSGVHDMNSEFNTLLQLHMKGALRMHVGSC